MPTLDALGLPLRAPNTILRFRCSWLVKKSDASLTKTRSSHAFGSVGSSDSDVITFDALMLNFVLENYFALKIQLVFYDAEYISKL